MQRAVTACKRGAISECQICAKSELGLVVGSREFFNGAPALETRKQLIAQLDRLNVGYDILRSMRRRMEPCSHEKTHVSTPHVFANSVTRSTDLSFVCPTSGTKSRLRSLSVKRDSTSPILLQASNDEVDKVDLAGRRDAFCGKFSVANNFYQYGVPFTDTTSHT